MMRSMYSGVSGLRVHQTKMDVIGNNIANVNTVGFKKSQVSFQEAFSQVIRGAGAPQGGKGGTNPFQIGLGVNLGSINTIHTTGAAQRTDNPTDLMIDGDGFFIVSDDPNADNRYYTRAGNFNFDVNGNLVTADGFKVLGTYIGDSEYAKFLQIEPGKELDGVKVNKSIPAPPTASTNIEVRGNLDSRIEKNKTHVTDVTIRDSLGNPYVVKLEFAKGDPAEDETKWTVNVTSVRDIATGKYAVLKDDTDSKEADFSTDPPTPTPTPTPVVRLGTITFDANGKIVDKVISSLELAKTGVNFGNNGAIDFNLEGLTQFANESDAKAFDKGAENGESGRTSGSVTGFAIDASGTVVASFSNGVKMPLWEIKLAKFDNPMGLVKVGNNFFGNTPNSGEPQIGTAGSSGLGAITPGALEMSNVDLSMEFTEMITTQRGFQANSRIITTSDEMLQELVNMKR